MTGMSQGVSCLWILVNAEYLKVKIHSLLSSHRLGRAKIIMENKGEEMAKLVYSSSHTMLKSEVERIQLTLSE